MKFLILFALVLTPVRAADLVIAAAADLAPFTSQLEKQFTAGHLRFSIAASGALARQIENGAPFDVFLSANEQYVKDLEAKNLLIPATVVNYATGRIAVWSADGSVRSLEDLVKPGVRHVAIPNPQTAPYGIAAKKALETRGLWKQVEPKIVYGENVRQALQFAESRNADAVITSWSLLKGRGTLLPADWHDPIRQSGGVLSSSKQPDLARRFLDFLLSTEGQRILQ